MGNAQGVMPHLSRVVVGLRTVHSELPLEIIVLRSRVYHFRPCGAHAEVLNGFVQYVGSGQSANFVLSTSMTL